MKKEAHTPCFLFCFFEREIIPIFVIGLQNQVMTLIELFIIALGLAMDAFAVSICKGLSLQRIEWRHMAAVGGWFGGFQALMPLLGYLLGATFAGYISEVDHWVAFLLLGLIGFNMLRESLSQEDEEGCASDFRPRTLFLLAVATSIDALAVGVTFAFLQVHVGRALLIIGVVTALLSALGLYVGRLFGAGFKHHAERAGGVVLILIGLKILVEHLWFTGA